MIQIEEALKELLEAVEDAIQAGDWKVDGACDPDSVIRRSKEALAQPEQEPVGAVKDLFTQAAWEKLDVRGSTKVYLDIPPQRTEQEPFGYFQYDIRLDAWVRNRKSNRGAAFYIRPPQRTWVGLTDEEKNDCLVSADPCEALAEPEARQLIEDVEQALKVKNT